MSDIFNFTFTFSELSVNLKHSLFVIFMIMVLVIVIGKKIGRLKPTDRPKGLTFIVIMAVDMLNQFIKGFYGRHWRRYAPLLLAVFMYLIFANTASLLGLATPLSNVNIALSFSLLAFLTIQISALMIRKPWNRIKDLSSPNALLLPINLFGEFSTPLAMGLRLFGNLLSGAVIAVLIYSLFGGVGILGSISSVLATMFLLHPIFNIFFGVIQAFVYFMLLTIFLSMAIEEPEITA